MDSRTVANSGNLFEKVYTSICYLMNLKDDMEQDPVVRGRPISLQSKDGHTLWVSKKVLESIHPIPEEIEGGTVIRDSNGKPIGTSSASYLL